MTSKTPHTFNPAASACRRYALPLLLFILSVFCLSTPADASRGSILSQWHGDLNRDHRPVTVSISCTEHKNGHPVGGEIRVARNGRTIWKQPKLNPWKLLIADVDGDGRREIIAGVWKKSPKDPVMAKRVFVYSWNGERMLPKWLGSKLSRRFDDFTFCDINRDGWDELFALEIAPNGKHRIAAYRWNTFGFDWLGCSPETAGLTALTNVDGRVRATMCGRRHLINYISGRITIL